MNEAQVPIIVLSARQDDVEFINQTLRDAGHPVHCHWAQRADRLGELLAATEPQLLLYFCDEFPGAAREVAKTRQAYGPMIPLLIVSPAADEAMITDAMQLGAQDLVSSGQRQRLLAVAEREMRSFRLERALNETLRSASEYKKQIKTYMAGAVDAMAEVQEGIVVEANQSWAELFGHDKPDEAVGPLMDAFEISSQAALKGALIACSKGHWGGESLRVTALRPDGRSAPLEIRLESSAYDGDSSIKLTIPRIVETPKQPEELVAQAIHIDPSTGFYQRQRFIELLTDRLDDRPQSGVRALTFIRLDKFREVDDELGPVSSEELLVQLAELFRLLVKKNDLCGRFGGTVFTIVVERGTLRDIEAWAEHALGRVADHFFEVTNKTLSVTCTIGLAELGPGTDRVEDLIKNAERANQRGRQRGGNQVVLEETSDESTRIKRFDALWLHQIKSALLANRFRLTHLSIASLSGQAEKFFDTILRMIDEQGDDVPASEFMEVARRNKMMRPLDRWVIGATLEFAASQHFDLVFIKLSGETIGDATTVDWIKAQAAHKSIPPGRLCFQISESDATQHLKQTLKIVGDLRGAGFKFAIEHFGIGRDPLRLLNQMPMDFVKIDGSLMEGIGGDSMRQEKIRSFVNMALKRKVATIAERVEDANTMAVLFQLGIGYMQGHYLHEPDVVLEELI